MTERKLKCLNDLYFKESVCSCYVFNMTIALLTFSDSVIAKYSKC